MALEFDGASGIVTFAADADVDDLDEKTIIVVFESGLAAELAGAVLISKRDGAGNGWVLSVNQASDNVTYIHEFSVDQGGWNTPTNSVIVNTIHHAAISYDRRSDANNPVFYIDGASVTVSEGFTPAGNATDDNTEPINIGNRDNAAGSDDRTFDGIVSKILIYNRIMTAQEIADDFNSRLFISTYKGLVWACGFLGATGHQTYDGEAITGTFKEHTRGVVGTPANTPTGRGDIWLSFTDRDWTEGRGAG